MGAFLGLVWWQSRAAIERPAADIDALPPALPSDQPAEARAVKPSPPAEGYVGSDACAKGHTAIAETYAKHPMSRSAGRVPGEHEVEAFGERAEFRPHGNRRYRVERTENQVIHHEIMLDAQGEVIYDDAEPIRLFIGSGARGKTYAIFRGGHLYESPIS